VTTPEEEGSTFNQTLYNLDSNCYSGSPALYKDDEANLQIVDFFDQHCFEKNECSFSPEVMHPRDFNEMFSDFCKERI
jgi:hypothetical protein